MRVILFVTMMFCFALSFVYGYAGAAIWSDSQECDLYSVYEMYEQALRCYDEKQLNWYWHMPFNDVDDLERGV